MTGTWEQHYAEAQAYYEQNGHLEVSCHSSLYVGYLSSAMPDGENGGR